MSKLGNIIRPVLTDISPVFATKMMYRHVFGQMPDLENPKTLNEKLQYLKFHDYYDNDTITACVDKYEVKNYLTKKGYEDIVVPLYGVYDSADEIDFDALPEKFVIKTNHGSGTNFLCEDKSGIDKDKTRKLVNGWLKKDYWREFAEIQYKKVKKKVLIEKYLGTDIHTYKFYCFNGEPKVMYISSNGENGEYDKYYDYFDMDWNHLNMSLKGHENLPDYHVLKKPDTFDKMKQLAGELCKPFPFVRIDLYDINGKIYFSEYTFIPTGGFMKLTPDEVENEWGSWLDISKK